jgi:mono/diheme cytochrome c family protein
MSYRMMRGILPLLFVVLVACSNLSGEPEIVRTFAPPATDALRNPVLTSGAEVYTLNCTTCHGINGAGNGELVQSGQVMNPGNFTDPEQKAGQTPVDYFNIVTNGNLANLMPPWENALDAEARWQVALYNYLLHYTPEQVERGERLFTDEIAATLTRALGDLSVPEVYANTSNDALLAALDDLEDNLEPAAKRDVTAYVRVSNLNEDLITALAQTEATPEVTPFVDADAPSGTITGQVFNGTEGGTVPDEMTISLRIFSQASTDPPPPITTMTNPDGSYRFEDVPVTVGNVYVTSVNYLENNFVNPFEFEAGQTEAEAPLTIYEATNNAAVITVDQLRTDVSAVTGALQITHTYVVSNGSDRMYTSGDTLPDGRPIGLEFDLPPGSIIVPDGTDRFAFDEDTFTYIDTRGLPPGDGFPVDMVYFLPYEQSALVEFAIGYPLRGPVFTLITTEDLEFSSERQERISEEEVQLDVATAYGANLSLTPGELIRFRIDGEVAAQVGSSVDSSVVTSNNLLPVIAVTLAGLITVASVGVFFVHRSRTQAVSDAAIIDGLARQISALDAQHDAGEINHDVYQRRRAQLQARLDERMDADEEHIS